MTVMVGDINVEDCNVVTDKKGNSVKGKFEKGKAGSPTKKANNRQSHTFHNKLLVISYGDKAAAVEQPRPKQ
jgi:hypothetical protein